MGPGLHCPEKTSHPPSQGPPRACCRRRPSAAAPGPPSLKPPPSASASDGAAAAACLHQQPIRVLTCTSPNAAWSRHGTAGRSAACGGIAAGARRRHKRVGKGKDRGWVQCGKVHQGYQGEPLRRPLFHQHPLCRAQQCLPTSGPRQLSPKQSASQPAAPGQVPPSVDSPSRAAARDPASRRCCFCVCDTEHTAVNAVL